MARIHVEMMTLSDRDLVAQFRARTPQTALACIRHLEDYPPTGYRVMEAGYRRRPGRSGKVVELRIVLRHMRRRAHRFTPNEAIRELREDYLLANPRGD